MKESKNAKTVTNEDEITLNPGDEITIMNPTGVFYYTQDFNVPVAVGVENKKLKIKAIDKNQASGMITGLKFATEKNATDTTENSTTSTEDPVFSVIISSEPLEVNLKDGSVKVSSVEFSTGPLMIKDSSITGAIVAAIDVVIVCRYMGISTIQHFRIPLSEVLESAK